MLEETVRLPDYVSVLKRRRLTVVAVFLLGIVAGIVFVAVVPKRYTSTVKILVRQEALDVVNASSPATSMDTEREVAASPAVASLAAPLLGSTARELLGHVATDNPSDTLILEISYSDPSRGRATAGARIFGQAYLQFKSHRLIAEGNRAAAAQPGVVISPAQVPTTPSRPNPKLDIGLAAFMGLFLGIVLAFVRERVDPRIRDRAVVEEILGTPVLAVIPPGRATLRRPLRGRKPIFPAISAYMPLGAALLRRSEEVANGPVLVTGPAAGTSVSAVVANLGVVLAQAGERVILVSADLRHPRVHAYFGVANEAGLAEALDGDGRLAQPEVPTEVSGLAVVPAGTSGRAFELAHLDRLRKLLGDLRGSADMVVVEGPPVPEGPDGLILTPLADTVIVAVDASSQKRARLRRLREELDAIGVRPTGAVIVNLRTRGEDA